MCGLQKHCDWVNCSQGGQLWPFNCVGEQGPK